MSPALAANPTMLEAHRRVATTTNDCTCPAPTRPSLSSATRPTPASCALVPTLRCRLHAPLSSPRPAFVPIPCSPPSHAPLSSAHPALIRHAPASPAALLSGIRIFCETVAAEVKTPTLLSVVGERLRKRNVEYAVQGGGATLAELLQRHAGNLVTVQRQGTSRGVMVVTPVPATPPARRRDASPTPTPATPADPRDQIVDLAQRLGRVGITSSDVVSPDSARLELRLRSVSPSRREGARAEAAQLRRVLFSANEVLSDDFRKIDKLNAYLALFDLPPAPSVTKAVAALKAINVNIFDLLSARLTGTAPRVHATVHDLAEYTFANHLVYPKALAKASSDEIKVFLHKLK